MIHAAVSQAMLDYRLGNSPSPMRRRWNELSGALNQRFPSRCERVGLHDEQISENEPDKGEIIVYHTEDGRVRLDVRLQDETVWWTRQEAEDHAKSE
jgi:hypothetical protein